MADDASGKAKHVGGKIKEEAGDMLGDSEMEREGRLDQEEGRAEQDEARAREQADEARARKRVARDEKNPRD